MTIKKSPTADKKRENKMQKREKKITMNESSQKSQQMAHRRKYTFFNIFAKLQIMKLEN